MSGYRRFGSAAVLLVLAVAAAIGLLRAAQQRDPDPVQAVAAELRCPACQGESVADSRSPIAAAMREVVARQLAEGRTEAQVRAYFVQRYGEEVLASPAGHRVTMLLWAVPGLVLLVTTGAAVRTLRARARPRHGDPPSANARSSAAATRAWWATVVGVAALVGTVAVASGHLDPEPAPVAQAAADPTATTVLLAHDLEQQGWYADAVQLYRQALQERTDPTLQLRLAFALIRAGQPGEAEAVAQQVLAGTPDLPDGLLVLGLAQRDTAPAAATATLRRFVTVAPGHPATAEIHRLLGGAGTAQSVPRPAASVRGS